jgi:hypothetical protein
VHPAIPNTIATIDPPSGSIVGTIQVGSEPGPMALCAGGQFLYVGLYGEPAVQRIDLDGQAVDLVIPLGEHESYGPYYAEDLACIPGEPESIAASRFKRNFSPRHAGVALYDRDVMRPMTTHDHLGSNRIESSGSSSVLYGFENESTGFRLREVLISEEGLTEGSVWSGLVAGFDGDIVYEDGLIFGSNGAVVDAASGTLQGTLLREGFEGPGPVAPDIANDRVHFISAGPGFILTLRSYVLSTYEQAGAAALPFPFNLPPPWRVTRWGVDGLAYTSTDGLVLLRTSFASD